MHSSQNILGLSRQAPAPMETLRIILQTSLFQPGNQEPQPSTAEKTMVKSRRRAFYNWMK